MNENPRNPLKDPELEADVLAGAKMINDGHEPQVVVSAMALTALRRPDIEHDVMRAVASLKKHPPEVVLRALVLTMAEKMAKSAPLTAESVLGPASPPRGPAPAPFAGPPPGPPIGGPRNLSPLAGGVAPSQAPDPATFGEQNF
jgi:hypothetical protein